jgi:hypothetical protein
MASEAPRSAVQATKDAGRSKQPGHKTKQHRLKNRTTCNAESRSPHTGQRLRERMDCGREWRTGCLGCEQREGNWDAERGTSKSRGNRAKPSGTGVFNDHRIGANRAPYK